MRQQVQIVDCGRCHRLEHVPMDDKTDRSFSMWFGETVALKYDDLCTTCLDICKGMVDTLSPKTKKSSKKGKKVKPAAEVNIVTPPVHHPVPMKSPK